MRQNHSLSWFPTAQIPDSIGQLRELRRLQLQNNRSLRALPRVVCECTKLLELDISGCSRFAQNGMVLSETIGQLVNLEVLRAGNNRLKRLPESIGRLVCLTSLSVQGNLLTTVGEHVCARG